MMTKDVNVFDHKRRCIKCIANEHDYLGDGTSLKENQLEVGKVYHMVRAEANATGEKVYLEEVPSNFGFQAYLFEELEEYDRAIYDRLAVEWFMDTLKVSDKQAEQGRMVTDKKAMERLRAKIKGKNFLGDVICVGLKEWRINNNATTEGLAKLIGCVPEYLTRLENEEMLPDIETALKLQCVTGKMFWDLDPDASMKIIRDMARAGEECFIVPLDKELDEDKELPPVADGTNEEIILNRRKLAKDMGLSMEQEDFLAEYKNYPLAGGLFNDEIRGYLITAAEKVGLSREETDRLLNGLAEAFRDTPIEKAKRKAKEFINGD
ncbi:MAG: helix-turn-helix transcriptional regulator [Lachnospiraceae bacterium]|nr:helix-turn-helix transcriptional regulator [Lachnospiraceae bacterium]